MRDHPEQVLASWAHRFERSPMRMGSTPSREYGAMISAMIEELAGGLPLPGREHELTPGAAAVRELEKTVTFAGASLAAAGAPGFDVAAALLCLRDALFEFSDDALVVPLTTLFEWLAVVALDAHGNARVAASSERSMEQLERGTPVVLVTPGIPATLLVADPDEITLDSVFGRLALLVVRAGPTAVVIDATGLADAGAAPVLRAFERFAGHEVIAGKVTIYAVGLGAGPLAAWQRAAASASARFEHQETFEQAITAVRARR